MNQKKRLNASQRSLLNVEENKDDMIQPQPPRMLNIGDFMMMPDDNQLGFAAGEISPKTSSVKSSYSP
jgi:hypothetical protein